MDLDYVVGSNKFCNNVLCCRAENGTPENSADGAGVYGSVAYCDSPVSMLDKMTEKINELAPDVLFWTGDVVPHDSWNYSQEYVEKYQVFLFDYMSENLGDWRTYPLEGNHDFGDVINSQNFATPDPLLPFLANYWSQWLDEDALNEVRDKGFYSASFSTSDGTLYNNVKVIAINS